MNALAVTIAVILLPGLVATIICDKIIVHQKKWEIFKYSIYSFIFGVACYSLLQISKSALFFLGGLICSEIQSRPTSLKVWGFINQTNLVVNFTETALAACLAPFIALAASAIVNHKLIHRFCQKFNISSKYGDENLFSYFLSLQDVDWIYIRDKKEGFTYFGRVLAFSETDAMQEITLYEVDVHDYETSEKLYSVSRIYLSKPHGSFIFELPQALTDGEQNGSEK